MQLRLVNPKITRETIIDIESYNRLRNNHQFILYSDNILEGITLLNYLTASDDILKYCFMVYQPIDQPIYVFSHGDNYLSIKVCGAFDKWKLPDDVCATKSYVDLPDYILYSVESGKAIFAGESTETASVGNSQWQREGRKLGAARNGIPFVYQTFYSGKDESQGTIREPTSLQVYNHILYTARYKVPSFAAYFENNFEGAKTRERTPVDSQELFSNYIKMILLCDVDNSASNIEHRKQLEVELLKHMLSYLGEGKFKANSNAVDSSPRINKDLPTIDPKIRQDIVEHKEEFARSLIEYIYGINSAFVEKYDLTDFESGSLLPWSTYSRKKYIEHLLRHLQDGSTPAKTYASGNAKVGIAKTQPCKNYLVSKFANKAAEINDILDGSEEVVIMPLRVHKKSNGNLTFSPDPESGEIVAFSELLGYDMQGVKTRPVIGYCIVDTPAGFSLAAKQDTKLYKAIANYVDILIINDSELITTYALNPNPCNGYHPTNIVDEHPTGLTEEMGVVSVFLNQTTIKSDWQLCFIHTHHSSWQQMFMDGTQRKIGRISTKLDLVMQQTDNFMLAEGKERLQKFFSDDKIQKAMQDVGEVVDNLHGESNLKIDALIYNLATDPNADPEASADAEEELISEEMAQGRFSDVVKHNNFVIIIVYLGQDYKTKFRLVFSDDFDPELKEQLETEFL